MKIQRPVVECRWKAEAIIHQDQFSAPVAAIHAAYLGYGLVTFIDDAEKIFRKIIQQAERPCAGPTAIEKAGVIFDAVAVTQFPDHLQVVFHPFADPLRFDVFTRVFEISCLRRCFILYLVDHLLYDILGSYIEVGGEDGGVLYGTDPLAAAQFQGIDRFNLVAEETDAVTEINIGKIDIDRIAFDPEGSPGKIAFAPVIE
ncbi:MAG: hypothetical protein BWY71_02200 [Planctomycetes bacterium ADurb.Bin412]|nr:MAG: hypothetical protein BWY71_02200 [Planctomycetes bacterium ADurb.Bin412]